MSSRLALLAVTLGGCGGLGYYGPTDTGSTAGLSTLGSPTPVGGTTTTDGTTTSSTSSSTSSTTTTTTPTTTTTTTTTTAPPGTVHLRKVDPDFGSNLGGQRLTLTGSFDGNTDAYVDGVRADRRSRSTTEMVVTLPPSSATGWVDVSVRSGSASDTLPQGFQYWEDATGGTGAVGVVAYDDYVGGYWAGGTPNDVAYGRFSFVQSSSWEVWQDFAPSMNSCAFHQTAPKGVDGDMAKPAASAFDELDPGASFVKFLGPYGEVIRLDADTSMDAGWFTDLSLGLANVVPGELYDLQAPNGNADWPAFDVTGALRVPASFSIALPHLNQNDLPPVDRSSDFQWNNNTADYMVLWIRREAPGLFGWYTDGYMTCAMDDTGSFTIPANKWDHWYVGDHLYIKLGRVLSRENKLPHDNSTNHLAGIYWIYGGATTVN